MIDDKRTITIKCDKASIETDEFDSQLSVTLNNVDLDDLLAEFNSGDILSRIDYGHILEFINDNNESEDEE